MTDKVAQTRWAVMVKWQGGGDITDALLSFSISLVREELLDGLWRELSGT